MRPFPYQVGCDVFRLGRAMVVLGPLIALIEGCGPGPQPPAGGAEPLASRWAMTGDNGLTTNGLTTNGLTTNGLTTNGLTTDGLSAPEFSQWFNEGSGGFGNLVMTYVVRCALPAGQRLEWTNPSTGQQHGWTGGLGLAPGWASGDVASALEVELVSACLAAHVNKYGQNMDISVLGRGADGQAISTSEPELSTWSVREACFFGDLVSGGGVLSGSDRVSGSSESSGRACGLSSQTPGSPGECPPIVYGGSCASLCTLDPSGTFYESCTWNGRAYRPITTRIRPADVYVCGDGVCQVSESCGTGSTPRDCGLDCGGCP